MLVSLNEDNYLIAPFSSLWSQKKGGNPPKERCIVKRNSNFAKYKGGPIPKLWRHSCGINLKANHNGVFGGGGKPCTSWGSGKVNQVIPNHDNLAKWDSPNFDVHLGSVKSHVNIHKWVIDEANEGTISWPLHQKRSEGKKNVLVVHESGSLHGNTMFG